MAVDLELAPKQKRPAGRAVLRAGRLPGHRAGSRPSEWRRSRRPSATRSACSSSTCSASTPARSASASWCPSSTSPSRPSPTISRSCARQASSARNVGASGPTTTSSPEALEELSGWLSKRIAVAPRCSRAAVRARGQVRVLRPGRRPELRLLRRGRPLPTTSAMRSASATRPRRSRSSKAGLPVADLRMTPVAAARTSRTPAPLISSAQGSTQPAIASSFLMPPAGLARLRQSDRRRRPPRGRDSPRPRIGRWDRRASLRPPRRARPARPTAST